MRQKSWPENWTSLSAARDQQPKSERSDTET